MSSYIQNIDCKNCFSKESLIEESYYKTGEFYKFCSACGFTHNSYVKRDDAGEFILKDSSKPIDANNLIRTTEIKGSSFGVYEIKEKSGGGRFGRIETREEYKSFLQSVGAMDKTEIETIKISRFVEGTIENEIIFG